MAHEAGKGSGQRPLSIPQELFDQHWQQIFGRPTPKNENEITLEECLQDISDSDQVGP
jgi:hypothetical protein